MILFSAAVPVKRLNATNSVARKTCSAGDVIKLRRGCRRGTRFSCYVHAGSLFLSRVNRFKTIVSLIVLALWATCTVRCDIEILAHSGAMACCDESGDESNQAPSQPQHCVCSFIQSGGFISEKSGVPMPLPTDSLFISTVLSQANDSVPTPAPAELISPPPELVKSWQFSFRTALPPRAPSFVS